MSTDIEKNINVMTANIRFANEGDGENNWPHRKEFLAEIINEAEIHLLGTQEGREEQIRELCNLLPSLKLVDSHRNWIDERMYPCLYYNEKEFDLIKSGDIWLSETPHIAASKSFGSMFPRLCTYAQLRRRENKKTILFVNCHLDHLEEEIRYQQIKVLIEEVLNLNTSKLPIILVGDFNSGPYQSVRECINSSSLNLYDPWIENSLLETSSFHKFDGSDPTGNGLRIDWILLDKLINSNSIQMIKESKNGRYPSDHFFIKSKISL